MLVESEPYQVLAESSESHTDSLRGNTIHSLFEEQAALTPHAVAIEFEHQTLSYCELNERADRIAHRLRRLGMARETLVGLCMERSPELYVGMLAILKAGGAYVPLDPDYPDKRSRTCSVTQAAP